VYEAEVILIATAFFLGAFKLGGQNHMISQWAAGLDSTFLILGGSFALVLAGMLTGGQSTAQSMILPDPGAGLARHRHFRSEHHPGERPSGHGGAGAAAVRHEHLHHCGPRRRSAGPDREPAAVHGVFVAVLHYLVAAGLYFLF
jgi:hypothetical protein